jgi:NAD/NADP transhydrogenase alpha subunit
MVNGIAFSKGPIHLRIVIVDIIVDKGGDNEVASRGVRNGEFVEEDGKQIIQYLSLTWVIPAYPLRG